MSLRINEILNIKLNEAILVKLEDSLSKDRGPILVTIDASHYGFLNKNSVIYRHDTVRNNIGSFVYPNPKPIIQNHRPKTSDRFGSVVAAEYLETEYYKDLSKLYDMENLSTLEYMNMCKDAILPYQMKNKSYNGLGYCQVVGKIDHKDGIKKILDKEFLFVSIGADPKKLICSECLQDQTVKICDHYGNKRNNIFMLAEDLEYEELSLLTPEKTPADKFVKITVIQDSNGNETIIEQDDVQLESKVDIIFARDFFEVAEGKKIVCVDNICTVVNKEQIKESPEEIMNKEKDLQDFLNKSYLDEFVVEKLKDLKLTDDENIEESLKLEDEEKLTNKDFAIIQKTSEGTARRFPVNSEINVKAAIALIDSAEDLTEAELTKAKAAITKAGKKFKIEVKFKDEEKETEKEDSKESDDKLQALADQIKEVIEAFDETKLQDNDGPKPMAFLFSTLSTLGNSIKWAGEDLKYALDGFLKSLGQIAVEKGQYDSLQDDLKDIKEENELLEEQNRELNFELRASLVDEIIEIKKKLEILDSEETEKDVLFKTSYSSLVKQAKDYRKLNSKLTDSTTVNNKTEVTTISDPTLADSATKESDTDNLDTKLEDEVKPTEAELVQAFINLFRK